MNGQNNEALAMFRNGERRDPPRRRVHAKSAFFWYQYARAALKDPRGVLGKASWRIKRHYPVARALSKGAFTA